MTVQMGGAAQRRIREDKIDAARRAANTPRDEYPENLEADTPPESNHRKKSAEQKGPRFPGAIPASELKSMDPTGDWIWHGYAAKGCVTLFNALWKAGKSTLLAHLLRATGDGEPLCGLDVKVSRVLVVTEEPVGLWVDRRDSLGIEDNVHFVLRPFNAKPTAEEWRAFIGHVAQLCDTHNLDCVIFDTISSCWSVQKENDAAEVQSALMPLRSLTDAGRCVILVHHPRKTDGAEATSARGSGALSAFVDVIVELRRYNQCDRHDRKRVLSGYGRYTATPEELVIELSEDGKTYSALGDKVEIGRMDRMAAVWGILPEKGPGLTVGEVRDAWTAEPQPGLRTLRGDLRHGADKGRWVSTGAGTRGDPHRYWRGAPV